MPVVELLQSHHDRQSFDCGKSPLNDFLQRQAKQNAARDVGVTHVVVDSPGDSPGDSRILGYYTLVTRTVGSELFPIAKKLPRGPIGVALLGRLAVNLSAQRRGIGTAMLLRAMRQVETASRDIGIYALVLDAIDEDARRWYLGLDFGFEQFEDDPNRLFIRMSTIRQLLAGAP